MRYARRARSAVAVGAAATVAACLVVAVPLAASAAPGDADATALVVDLDAELGGVPLLAADVTAAAVSAPVGGGTDTANLVDVGAGVGAIGTTLSTGVVTATATRAVNESSSASSITDLDLGLLATPGLGITADAVNASATCTIGVAPAADAAVTGLALLGTAVTLDANAPTASVTLAVTVPGAADATITAVATRTVTLTATTAAAAAVDVDLTLDADVAGAPVSIPLGSVTLAQASCELPPFGITTVAPTTGPTSGGTLVTVNGTGLDTITAVTVGGEPATGLVVAPDGTSVQFTTPASETAGDAPIVLTGTTGSGPAGVFAYVAPTVTAVTPAQGSTAGNEPVTVTGTGLQGATAVTFGGVSVPVTSVAPDGTSVTATTPPGTAGTVDVGVTLPGLDGTLPDGYLYLAPGSATITGLTPTSGPVAGGTTVVITGTGLATTTSVTFGTGQATIVGQPTDTSLTVRTPPGPVGPVDVTVTNAVGATPAPNAYTYLDDGSGATFTGLTPTSGPTSGGTSVVISGTGLGGATGVTIGGTPATVTAVAPDGTSITVTTPPSETAGPRAVVVTFPAGTRPAGTFTYVAPAVSGVSPGVGPTTGGTTVTVTGSDLGATTEVLFGGVPGTGLVVAPDGTSLTVVAPPHSAGAVDVTLVAPGADTTVPGAFTYAVQPTVAGIFPASGPTSGGQTVVITGSGFDPAGTTVTFGGVPATNVRVLSPGVLLAVTPAGTAGDVPVQVVVGGLASAPLTYTYDPAAVLPGPPVVTGADPSTVGVGGGVRVLVRGSGFVPGQTSAFICGTLIPASQVEVNAAGTSLSLAVPACDPGSATLLVITPGGTDSVTLTYANTIGGRLATTGVDGGPQFATSATALLLWGALMLLVARTVRRRRAI
ncbi:IPT/TIG domain-containing protein [Cellulomonas sp. RIT-PI-Y]|uniref:beta strand repeat-containing protein n=1 Tax=Cellulomonas sp. RIT-PI-Y TaxID=3035297 RepID=UPI0021D94FC2|nr:IPT/TIG domain-containing protein [Cellulomonas sp. RIT-PI-Y]